MNGEQKKKTKEYYGLIHTYKCKLYEINTKLNYFSTNCKNSIQIEELKKIREEINMKLKEMKLSDYINCTCEICLDFGVCNSFEKTDTKVRRFKCLDCGKIIEFSPNDEAITSFIEKRIIIPSDSVSSNDDCREYFNDIMNPIISTETAKTNAVNRYRYRSKNYDYKEKKITN